MPEQEICRKRRHRLKAIPITNRSIIDWNEKSREAFRFIVSRFLLLHLCSPWKPEVGVREKGRGENEIEPYFA